MQIASVGFSPNRWKHKPLWLFSVGPTVLFFSIQRPAGTAWLIFTLYVSNHVVQPKGGHLALRTMSDIIWGNVQQRTHQKEAWIAVFKPNSQNTKTCILSKNRNYCIDSNQILHSDKDHLLPFVGDPNTRITNPWWRMAAILENRKIAISPQRLTDRREIWHMVTHFDHLHPNDR